ncbi:MAG: DUF3617 domain-containing protein [Phenylobacterium sp.]|uniref:DUF3617 domain-containing protein n=1 Tax=Phenylobacterium sp. TaxID=1871053 RepID=UPI0025DBE6FF|nr:DUF3617 family protein [Phenylobacterium sp.]MCG9916267.1 DUF3617 domain-containing protein [Phenylobacterium sp.]
MTHAASSALAPLALALLALAGPAAAADSILPGYWESTNRMLSPIRTTDVEKRCLTKADVEKFMMGPSNRHYTCTYPTRSFAGGKILLKGSCVSKKGREVAVSGEGNFTPTTFKLVANIATTFAGIPVSGRASTEARRLSETCPPKDATD